MFEKWLKQNRVMKPPLRIPVAQPKLPSADAILPYLRRIDDHRIYTNFGPLSSELEERLAAHFALPRGSVVTVTNATHALAAALIATKRPGGAYCLLPSWTFCASAHAVILAGLKPLFFDVDPYTWQMDVAAVRSLPSTTLEKVAAVMPVAPFGFPVDGRGWDSFMADSGIPVVIDAAAGFDSLKPGAALSVVSLHATKALGAGEGSVVLADDPALIDRLKSYINFGFLNGRRALSHATNAKMSEYAAAVALASLDAWQTTREQWLGIHHTYAALLSSKRPRWFGAAKIDVASSTVTIATNRDAAQARIDLARAGIDTRSWWEGGCHREPAFADQADYILGSLQTTETLARNMIGLPCFPGINAAQIAEIVDILAEHVDDRPCPGYSPVPAAAAS